MNDFEEYWDKNGAVTEYELEIKNQSLKDFACNFWNAALWVKWKPIEDCPIGQPVLLKDNKKAYKNIFYLDDERMVRYESTKLLSIINPTHYHLLPEFFYE